jgi:hypothetical protein
MAEFRLDAHPEEGYLYAVAHGDRTQENAFRTLKEAHAACVRAGRDSLLVEFRLEGPPLDIATIFHVVSERSMDGAQLRRIAYVETPLEDFDLARFAEVVALNRGVNVRLFADVEAARRWLEAAAAKPA